VDARLAIFGNTASSVDEVVKYNVSFKIFLDPSVFLLYNACIE